jgi:hypothetical protein
MKAIQPVAVYLVCRWMHDVANWRGNVPREVTSVRTITFNAFDVSHDGEALLFYVSNRRGEKDTLAIHWLQLAPTLQIMLRAAKAGAKKRKSLGKVDDLDVPAISPMVVAGIKVADVPDRKLKILVLKCPSGLRCDFALSSEKVDRLGRTVPEALAEELVGKRARRGKRLN